MCSGAEREALSSGKVQVSHMAAVPNLSGTKDRFRGRQFFHGRGGEVGVGDGSGGNASDGKRQMKLCSLTIAHLLLCGPVPNRPPTGTGPRPRGWGPLTYRKVLLPGCFLNPGEWIWHPKCFIKHLPESH